MWDAEGSCELGKGISALYTLKKVGRLDIIRLNKVASILNACGKDMAIKYDLHHWDNPYLKSFVIVGLCALKNNIYLLYADEKPVATFMTTIQDDALHFEKLGTLPSEAGKGIGSLCMSKIEEIAKNAGCKKVVMEVYELSQHALSFYKHKGYKAVGMIDTLKYKEVRMERNF